ncbi:MULTISPECIES: methyltransferase domain-containing protein [unclassified Streptomyces]|uniref:methyltransferase domain-containing protein n=1 Tax=unclassified Streptomyces TaxID=2593676 RepID=UPI0004CC6182|nr:methyltransferase domain-containing protein [Streptomyces sp. NRRL F-5630]
MTPQPAQPARAPRTEEEWQDLATRSREGLLRRLSREYGLLDEDSPWYAAFASVPRHYFVPYYYVRAPTGGFERLWGEDPDRERRARWLTGAYADVPLATRLRDGELVSSSSQPSLMARMLNGLDVRPGDRVLEVGAGTGWNAGLLCHRLGEDLVTTVDLDTDITESARAHLARAGFRPEVGTGDGMRGWPARAPYDRVLITAAVHTVPRALLRQCAPGALVVAPLATGLLALRVRDAEHAEGRFLATPAYFVPMRGAERTPEPAPYLGGLPSWAARDENFHFLLALTSGILDPHEALALWRRERMPARERFGVTLRGTFLWAWLDDPDGPYAWALP